MKTMRVLAGLLALAAAQCAWAGVFSVTPVRIYMMPKDRAVAVTIVNEADEPVALQADVYEWKQGADGADELVPSEDLILAPPIIKLAAKAKQVVRLARLTPPDASRQLTYRLILRELPEASLSKGITVPVALALSMPVFITPPNAKQRTACEAAREQGTLVVYCTNSGNAYAQVREVLVNQNGQNVARFEGGAYILPGARRRLALNADQPVPAGAVQLVVTYDDGSSQTFDLAPL
ncbi:MAG TPA: fimbria/pilus periplasmic chaperone [Burkholderiales bacterium]|jgi:fimbrial chaperone protein